MSELLDRLLKQEHRLRPDDLRSFDPGELRELQDIVTGQQATPNRVRAMGVLTAVQGAGAIPTLSAVLHDRQQDTAGPNRRCGPARLHHRQRQQTSG